MTSYIARSFHSQAEIYELHLLTLPDDFNHTPISTKRDGCEWIVPATKPFLAILELESSYDTSQWKWKDLSYQIERDEMFFV